MKLYIFVHIFLFFFTAPTADNEGEGVQDDEGHGGDDDPDPGAENPDGEVRPGTSTGGSGGHSHGPVTGDLFLFRATL